MTPQVRAPTGHLVIVEDHGLIAHTLATAIAGDGHQVQILTPLHDGLVDELLAIGPDVVLLDLDLGPLGDATRMVAPLTEAGIHVLVVTGVEDRIRHARCIAAGAVGVVSKWGSFDDLLEAITRTLTSGRLLTEHERQEHLALLREHDRAEQRRLAPFEALSLREAQVLGELMAGHTVAEIAASAYLSVPTIRSHVRAILTKLGASSQVVAVGKAHADGWVPPAERLPRH